MQESGLSPGISCYRSLIIIEKIRVLSVNMIIKVSIVDHGNDGT